MSTDRDTTRVVRSWLEEGVTALPDRVLDSVLDQLPATPQRRATWWQARRLAQMNTYAKLALAAAAAVLVVTIIGINLRPGGGFGGDPSPSPTPSLIPSPSVSAFPASGEIPIGSYRLTQGGARFTLDVATAGWISQDRGNMVKGSFLSQDGAIVDMPPAVKDGVYSDPCAHVPDSPTGPSAADLAAAVATIPGLDTTGPTDVTVGGFPAKLIVLTIPEDIGCAPDDFFLWYDIGDCVGFNPCPRWASQLGSTIRVWIVDVNGERVWLDAETYAGATPDIEMEINRIIDSIRFE